MSILPVSPWFAARLALCAVLLGLPGCAQTTALALDATVAAVRAAARPRAEDLEAPRDRRLDYENWVLEEEPARDTQPWSCRPRGREPMIVEVRGGADARDVCARTARVERDECTCEAY